MIKQAEILVVAPKSEFIVKANTKSGVVLAKVKWRGAFGPENQTMSTWNIGPIQLSDGKTNKAFSSDEEVDAVEKEIDDYIGDCDAQINNFMQHKSTKSGDRKVIKYVDDFADDRAYEAGFYNQDLEDQVDKLYPASTATTFAESIDMPGWVHLDNIMIKKDAMSILVKAMRVPNIDTLAIDQGTKTTISSIIDRIANALMDQDTMTPESWSTLLYDAISAGFGDSRFDEMSETELRTYVDSSVGIDSKPQLATFEGLFPEHNDSPYEESPHHKFMETFTNAKQSAINDGSGFGVIPCTDGNIKVGYVILDCMLKAVNNDDGLGEHIIAEYMNGVTVAKFKELAELALNQEDAFDLYEDDIREQYMSTHVLPENADESFDSILEAIRFDENEYVNHRTGTDYSKAFDALHNNVVRVKKLAQGIYHHNNVDRDNQITTHLVGNIETFLNKYMAEMEDVETEFPDSFIPALTNNVTNVVNRWVKNISELDTTINQHFDVTGITGKQVIGMYNTEVYPEMSDVGNMITKMKFGLNHKDPNKATALATKLAHVIKHIDATQQKFHDAIMQRVHAKKSWRQPTGTQQPSMA